MIEKNKELGVQAKEIAQEKIKKEWRNKMSNLAEKVILTPIKKWLEALKLLVSPEKSKKETKEVLLNIDSKKNREKSDSLDWFKKILTQLKGDIKIPYYYADYAKKWTVEAAQVKSVESLYDKVSHAKEDPNIIARWTGSFANKLLS